MQIQDFFKSHFCFIGYEQCIKKFLAPEVLEKEIRGLKRRKRIKEDKSLKLKTSSNIHIKHFLTYKYY